MRAEVRNAKRREQIEKRLLSVYECEEISGISSWSWRRWAYKGLVASVKISTRLMIEASEVDRVISENRRPRIVDAAA